jgi:hypothetical protein
MNVGRPNDKLEGMQAEMLINYFKVMLWSFNDDISADDWLVGWLVGWLVYWLVYSC